MPVVRCSLICAPVRQCTALLISLHASNTHTHMQVYLEHTDMSSHLTAYTQAGGKVHAYLIATHIQYHRVHTLHQTRILG